MSESREILNQSMTEDELLQAVVEAARHWGWKHIFHLNDRLLGVAAKQQRWDAFTDIKNFPDLILLRNDRIIAAELKRQNAEPRPEQRAWLQAFEDAGAETYVWKPMDLLDQTIDFVLA